MSILVGNDKGNVLVGGGAADTLYGKGGNDSLYGKGRSDALYGGSGSDRLYGGEGNDTLVGGLGRDFLTGGAGRDTFRFDDKDAGDATAGPLSDVILDLGTGDVIDLLAVDVLWYDGGVEPVRGGLSVTGGADGSAYITWNTFGTFHDIEVRGVTDLYDLLWNHIRWYADDNYGGFGTSVRIAAGDKRSGTIENGFDEDWFRLDVQANRLYTFTIAGKDGAKPALEFVSLDLYKADGEPVTHTHDEAQLVTQAAGTYYLQATNDFSGGVGSYVLGVKSVYYKDDYGDWDDPDRGEISAGTSKTGKIGHQGDDDAFAFAVEAGRTYTIDVKGASSNAGTLVDPYAVVYDPSGSWVTEDSDSGAGEDAQIVFTAWEDSIYTVNVLGENFGETGTYTVSLSVSDETILA